MAIFDVTVERVFAARVTAPSEEQAQKWVEALLDSDQLGDGDWDTSVSVIELDPRTGKAL